MSYAAHYRTSLARALDSVRAILLDRRRTKDEGRTMNDEARTKDKALCLLVSLSPCLLVSVVVRLSCHQDCSDGVLAAPGPFPQLPRAAVVVQMLPAGSHDARPERPGDLAGAVLLEDPQDQVRLLAQVVGRGRAEQRRDAAG